MLGSHIKWILGKVIDGEQNLIAPFVTKQKGCANTNEVKEDLNERCQGVQR